MKVPTLRLRATYITIDKDGGEHEIIGFSETGCWNMCFRLEREYGIETVPSTIYACKKIFTPIKFPYAKTKEEMLGYCNWVLNFPKKEERAEFYSNEPNKDKFTVNNPIVDIKIRISKMC